MSPAGTRCIVKIESFFVARSGLYPPRAGKAPDVAREGISGILTLCLLCFLWERPLRNALLSTWASPSV